MKSACKYIILLFLCLITTFSQAQFRSKKKGIAYGYHSDADLQLISQKLAWWYNWAILPDNKVSKSYESYDMDFVPMLWNSNADTAQLRAFLKTHPNVKYILGFNEPNFRTQANMTPKKAAESWPKIEELADEFSLKIVAPAVNYCDQCVDIPGTTADSSPFSWLDAFFEECPDCKVDYIAVHNYMCYASALQSNIEDYLKYGKKIWLTEFACWDQATITLDMQKSYVLGAIDYLENDSNIFRYSWFTGDRSGKWPYLDIYGSAPGSLTELGELYLNFYPVHDTAAYYPIPGRIEAESYNAMSGIQLEATSDFDGMANVGWFDGGDWLQFNVEVPDSGKYYLYARIASNAKTNLEVLENDVSLENISVPSSGGWQNWRTYEQAITLSKGKHRLKFSSSSGSLNINWIYFKQNQNNVPQVFADDDAVIFQPDNSIYLTSTGVDEDGDSLSYVWTKTAGKSDVTIHTPNASATEISGFTNGNYTFKVTVSDGVETASDVVKITVQNKVEVDFNGDQLVRLFPNPVKDQLKLEVNQAFHDAQIEIYATNGALVYTGKLKATNNIIDVSIFQKGLYSIRIFKDGITCQQTFLKE